MKRTAELSEDGIYRYRLGRRWGQRLPVVWVMLNPSIADAEIDDATVRRCIGYTQRWGHDALEVVNLFALRATKPVHLLHHPDPVGPDNGYHLRVAIAASSFVVAAWGAGADPVSQLAEPPDVMAIAHSLGAPVYCVGRTAFGHPRHPLYLPRDARLEPFA